MSAKFFYPFSELCLRGGMMRVQFAWAELQKTAWREWIEHCLALWCLHFSEFHSLKAFLGMNNWVCVLEVSRGPKGSE